MHSAGYIIPSDLRPGIIAMAEFVRAVESLHKVKGDYYTRRFHNEVLYQLWNGLLKAEDAEWELNRLVLYDQRRRKEGR